MKRVGEMGNQLESSTGSRDSTDKLPYKASRLMEIFNNVKHALELIWAK